MKKNKEKQILICPLMHRGGGWGAKGLSGHVNNLSFFGTAPLKVIHKTIKTDI